MFIELADRLRCVRPHEPIWLVLVTDEMHGRDVRRGTLGCPICSAHYPIDGGVADFSAGARALPENPCGRAAEEEVLRAAALLALDQPGAPVLLAGCWASVALGLVEMADGLELLLLDPDCRLPSGGGISLLLGRDDIPLRPATLRAAALDGEHATPALLARAAESLIDGGRLLAPATAAVPDGVRMLARDDRHWVAERGAPDIAPLLQLLRAPA